ncbi:MAG: dihydroorotate dehydrogenase (quinone), partial [Chloroflexi bacterium]|nr:dihydroorotate dehydrogenase (quinone) [Chloroflexota bacterium]
YRNLIRPLLFRLPPETAQKLAEETLKLGPLWEALSLILNYSHPALRTDLAGIALRNPVGLAAGYDKNFEVLPSLSSLGFGYVTGGTVTQTARPGNPKPRVLRYERDESLVNAYGFPSKGLNHTITQLQTSLPNTMGPVFASVSGLSIKEIVACHRGVEPYVAAVEINISSPNTAGLRAFHDVNVLTELLDAINKDRKKPLFVKMPPFPSDDTVGEGADTRALTLQMAAVCVERGVDALTVANTQPIQDSRLAVGSGGLSGKLVFPAMLRMVREMRDAVGDTIAINAVGGIFSGRDAFEALRAGADTVQILTSLIYRGPGVVKSINRELSHIMELEGLSSVAEIRHAA